MCLKGYRLTVVLFSFGGEAGCKAPGRGESCVFSGCRLRTSGFSKCSGKGGPIGTQAAYMRHPCRNMPFSDVLSENCCKQNGTLRKSNVLHQSTKGQVTCKTLPLILIQAPFSENIVRRKEESICQTLMM